MDEENAPGVVHITGLFSDTPVWWRYLPSGELIADEVEVVDDAR